jgi:GH15 family glucan-1,4-alpha-glucosidase
MSERKRDIRLFMHQAFAIGDSRSNTDTAQYLPDSDAILHYRGRRAFIISGTQNNDKHFDQYTVGLFGIEGHEGTFKDAEDGELSSCNVEHGRVDSTLRFRMELEPNDSGRVNYWIAAGTSVREALQIHKQILSDTIGTRIHATQSWWHRWLDPALRVIDRVEPEYRSNFIRSMMIVKSQIDKRGAVIASTDTAMLNYSRDAYAYCWPRDGAYVLWPLIRLGYTEEPLKFFEFCRRAIHPSGYLMHKFRADGALGSSWHPYIHDGIVSPPIQEDETALVVFVFAQFYQLHKDTKLIDDFYESMIKPMGDFMASYIDDETHLPKPTYDLWEEVFLTTTYSTAVTYAALLAAADIAEEANDQESAVLWRSAAEGIQTGAKKHLYNSERRSFYKGILNQNGEIKRDSTIDTSSVFGSFMFGLFPVGSEELSNAIDSLLKTFTNEQNPYGIPRYENDYYYRRSDNVTGNWWFITSFWLAQYYAETNNQAKAKEILDWLSGNMLSTGVMSEQINPETGEHLSVAPLTWSHAEHLATILDMITDTDKR